MCFSRKLIGLLSHGGSVDIGASDLHAHYIQAVHLV